MWISRNQPLFEKRSFSPKETILKVTSDAREWMLAQSPPQGSLMKPLIRVDQTPLDRTATQFSRMQRGTPHLDVEDLLGLLMIEYFLLNTQRQQRSSRGPLWQKSWLSARP